MSIIDGHTRECLTSLVDRSVTADVLIDELDRLALVRGYPAVVRCDNGPELACEAMVHWAGERIGLAFIPPGEPWRDGYVESFNGRVRDECLNINMSWSLAQAWVVIGDWKHDYNHRRRHSSLGYQAPGHLRCGLHPPMKTLTTSRSVLGGRPGLRAAAVFLSPYALPTRVRDEVCYSDYELPRAGLVAQAKVERAWRRGGFRKLRDGVVWRRHCAADGVRARARLADLEQEAHSAQARVWYRRRAERRARATQH